MDIKDRCPHCKNKKTLSWTEIYGENVMRCSYCGHMYNSNGTEYFWLFYSCFMRDLPSMCFPDLSEKALWLSHALLVKCLY